VKNFYIVFVEFFSILSKHVEHNKCPFFFQNVLVDLSISFRQIKHLNIGVITTKIHNIFILIMSLNLSKIILFDEKL